MFAWLKRIVAGSPKTTPPAQGQSAAPMDDLRQTLQVATVWQVVDRFLASNPTPTPFGVHALVNAGAANLLEPAELIQVCEKIQEHGYQYPLNPTLVAELNQRELLEFVRWHGQRDVEQEYYANESTLRELIQLFHAEQ